MIRSAGFFLLVVFALTGCQGSQPHEELAKRIENRGFIAVPQARLDGLSKDMAGVIQRRRNLLSAVLGDRATGPLEQEVAFGELGIAHLSAGLAGVAEPCFANAQSVSKEPFRWIYYRAQCLAKLEDHERVIVLISEALVHAPTSEVALILLGESFYKLNRLQEAGAVFAEAARYHPRSASAFFGKGRVSLSKHEYEKAITDFQRTLQFQPRADAVHYPLAQALRAVGDLKGAEQHLSMTGLIHPAPIDELMDRVALGNLHTVYRRGLDALRGGDLETARRLLGWSARLQPEFFEGRLNHGIALARSGQFEAALAEIEVAGSLQSKNPRVRFNRGTVLLKLGRLEEARIALEGSLEVNPNHALTHFNLASALRELNRDDEAALHLAETVRIDPKHVGARLWQARLLARSGRCVGAVTALSQANIVIQKNVEIEALLAQMLAACDRDREREGAQALEVATRAFEEQPNPAAASAVAIAYASQREFDNASKWQGKAISLVIEHGGEPSPEMHSRLERYQAGQWAPLAW